MSETFLILLAGGILLAVAVSDPAEVTLNWLRLAGILALCMFGLALFFYARRGPVIEMAPRMRQVQVGLLAATGVAVLGQLAFAQVAWRATQRAFAAAGFLLAVLAAVNVLHELMTPTGAAVRIRPKLVAMALQTLSCAGVAAVTGLALMDMLLGHAYLTASKMGIAPFRRLNLALAAALGARAVTAVGVVWWVNARQPLEMLWPVHGLYALTRWLVGVAVPAVFVYMAHDCVRRRSTQSATGILYVTGVLVFLGELVALYLLRETGLPF